MSGAPTIPETGCARTAPVFGRDIIAGYATRPVSFYGLDGAIDALVSGRADMEMSTKSIRESLLNITDDIELGSNGTRCRALALRRRAHPARCQSAPAL